MALATKDDVARILQIELTDAEEAAVGKALETAESWARRYLRDAGYAGGDDFEQIFHDVREDGYVQVGGLVTAVEVVDYPGADPRTLSTSEWVQTGDRLEFNSQSGWDPRWAPVDTTQRGVYSSITVTSDRGAATTDPPDDEADPSTVDPVVRDAVALAAAALWTRGPRLAKGFSGEQIGDYGYTLSQLSDAKDPWFEQSKVLLRPLRRRGSLVP